MEIYIPYHEEYEFFRVDCYECCELKDKLIQLSFGDEAFLICEICLMDALILIRKEK